MKIPLDITDIMVYIGIVTRGNVNRTLERLYPYSTKFHVWQSKGSLVLEA
jgi:hypothetical protein